jgi:predicted dehydrogenase
MLSLARGRPVTVGIVGSGAAARFHATNYCRVYDLDVRIKGIASRTPEGARAFAAAHELPVAYPSFEAVLDDGEIDLVDLCVPNGLHHELAIQCARAGKHLVVEKPLTGYFGPGDRDWMAEGFSRQEMLSGALRNADRMIAAARTSGVQLCYAENWVYAPPITRAIDLLSCADHTVIRIVAEQSHSGTGSDYNMRWSTAGGGSLFNKGCHPPPGKGRDECRLAVLQPGRRVDHRLCPRATGLLRSHCPRPTAPVRSRFGA